MGATSNLGESGYVLFAWIDGGGGRGGLIPPTTSCEQVVQLKPIMVDYTTEALLCSNGKSLDNTKLVKMA